MRHRCRIAPLVALAFAALPAQAQSPAAPLQSAVDARLSELEADLIAFRRDLHRHPELSGAEERTARVVAERLRALGLEVRTGVGGHGVVAILRGARPGPTVAFRADMDAVRSDAPDPVAFPSVTPGVRHICGHDIHTTVGVALAEGLAAVRDRLAGSLMLVFQPAEERGTGARAMLRDGVFGNETPAAIFAVHTSPYEVGRLGTRPGVLLAGRDFVRVALNGSGDLRAAADSVRQTIARVPTIGPDQANAPAPEGFIYAEVGPLRRAGDGWVLGAWITTAGDAARARARRAILEGIARMALPGVTITPTYEERTIAGVTNAPAVVEAASAAIRSVLGEETVQEVRSIIPSFSEDFGAFQERVPGAMYFLGVSNQERGWVGMPHSPDYVADERAILVGARAMVAAILARLGA